MTVRKILPDIETGALQAGRCVAAYPALKSGNRLTTAALIARKAGRNGIILLTFTT